MNYSSQIQFVLVGSRCGRVGLHLFCLCRDRKFSWHARGIAREFSGVTALWSCAARWMRAVFQNVNELPVSIHETLHLHKETLASQCPKHAN